MSPEGGPKDELPPEIQRSEPKTNSTNFKGNTITLFTNEYLVLHNATQEILLSPLPKKQPEYKLKGKSIEITLPDSLQENTTYALNFGKSITDNNEGNVLENYRFVFSTGPTIDSLKIKGKALDAYNGRPIENAGVFIYPSSQETKFWKVDPVNYAKTKTDGTFTLYNLKPGTYSILVLADKNQDFKFQADKEYYGIPLQNTLELKADTNTLQIQAIYCAKDWGDTLYITSSLWEDNRQLYAKLNRPTKDATIRSLDPRFTLLNTQWNLQQDSVCTWLNTPVLEGDSIKIELSSELGKDTISYFGKPERKNKKKGVALKPLKTQWVTSSKAQISNVFPVSTLQATDTLWLNDSTKILVTWFRDSIDHRILTLDYSAPESSQPIAILRAGKIKDIYDTENDSVPFVLNYKAKENYGNLELVLKDSLNRKGFIVLLNKAGKETVYPLTTTNPKLNFALIDPDKYRLKFIWDKNQDGLWTPGNNSTNVQPEEVYFYPEIIDLRANWDTNIEWILPSKLD